MEVHVVSTGYASPNAAQCRRSVKSQESGRDRVVFVPDILYIYDFARSFEMTASPAELAHLRATSLHVRSLPPYERIEAL